MSHHLHGHGKDTYNVTSTNPAALPGQVDGKEYKYERVETAKVDTDGTATLVDAREDRGKEDPGMNFQDMRPSVAPGTPIGVVPSAVTGVAPQQPVHQIPGAFIATNNQTTGLEQRTVAGEPIVVQQTTTTIKEKNVHH